ncbi:putative proton-dependent oligopeptide transporter family [Helianthus annuus]|uniref:Proton-dependent oligopeptide transporter family n=1 Tax=Helianthus annuus TaxID=4232 RepID=A0A251RPN9_HELAN|nr:protein NRT1/ PTR FAMILY 1.1 isoform X2 [Helianthus annuus]KAF5823908.1 putative proton-dependent oligopeptide transporter family [Helianthus annuus]
MEEEDLNIEDQQTKSLLDTNHDHKGGMKTMPFIIVNEAFEKVASYGLLPNMILYLTEVYNMQAVTGATVLYIWSAFSNGLSLFGAFVSDSYLGPFRVIAFGSLSTLLVRKCRALKDLRLGVRNESEEHSMEAYYNKHRIFTMNKSTGIESKTKDCTGM